ncbi:MAG: hypothetical protein WA093_01480 [Minisyncoccales bacterium]
MKFTDKDIDNLRVLYLRRYGTEISKQEAIKIGTRLVDLFRAILKPSPKINSGQFNKKTCQQKTQPMA